MFLGEVSTAQFDERGHADLGVVVELAGKVERCHGDELELSLVDRLHAEVPIKVGEGDGHDLAIVVEVIDHLVRPLADL